MNIFMFDSKCRPIKVSEKELRNYIKNEGDILLHFDDFDGSITLLDKKLLIIGYIEGDN